ncbi:sugar kinase [Herbiconiux sp. VKM Ac-1786]|uniref:sugar kinase n=1 Tax=Herbiconiux sp. VKM Ac-1786 TaxID=2783824 RepID=UPI00188D8D62|nr:sugar kinase [Herbiconiux sp. VKM Ac-1786]MBF4571342.1 sugar kinase [Herbiconiux sp. VKM Ac-1786]
MTRGVVTRGVVTLGESMALIRGDGVAGLEHLATARIETGGAEGNVAVGLTRLGVDATWLGRVGDDALGRRVAGELRAEGVHVVAIVDAAAPTGLMIKNTPHAGRTAVTYYRAGSAGSRLTPADLDRIDFAQHALLHLTGITPALSASARETAFAAVELARAAGCAVSFDVNLRASLWPAEDPAPVLRSLAARCDIVIAGDDEARLITGSPTAVDDPTALLEALRDLGPREAVVKRGPLGASASAGGEVVHQAAFAVPVVDTVGAGDAFTAAYLARRLEGAPLADAVRTAAIAGAIACTHPSDWLGYARPADLAAFDAVDPVRR